MPELDTIAAIATPPGRGGIGVVRVSGPAAEELAVALCNRVLPERRAVLSGFRAADGSLIDRGLALLFRAPHSFTGEHVLELHGHGGPVVMDMLLARVVELGARQARPGEFSERAFLNDRLDLAQAEAVADLIESASEEAARAAMRSLQGEFSERVRRLGEQLVQLRAYLEAALDFADEDLDLLADPEVRERVERLDAQLAQTLSMARQGVVLGEGLTVVIAGAPNVGKSSLVNRLAARDTAIVTSVPGTTRDVLRERIHIGGLPLHILDTAGLRSSDDPVEREGIARAWRHIDEADLVVLVGDATERDAALRARLPPHVPVLEVRNKIDLTDEAPARADGRVSLSALTGAGLDLLREELHARAGYRPAETGVLSARRRHLVALEAARAHLGRAASSLREHGDSALIAEELALAHRRLGEITGEFTSEDLLGEIFSRFCIGK